MNPSNPRGNILIAALWVLVILSLLTLALSYEARGDIERTRLHRDRAKAYWLARAGVERAKFDFAMSRLRGDEQADRKLRFRYEFDEGYVECQVRSNASKMSVNTQNRDLWDQLLRIYYPDEDSIRDEIIDAIFDWTDPDDLERLNGVESDYYLGLSPPYHPRNGPFFSVEEILLVRGVTERMFHGVPGAEGLPGLKDILSTDAPRLNKFDINSCPKGVLMAFLEIDAQTADELIQRRSQALFVDLSEAMSIVPIEASDKVPRFFMTHNTNQIAIKSTGFVYDSPARYTVENEVRFTGGGGGNLFITLSHKDFSLEHVDEMLNEEAE